MATNNVLFVVASTEFQPIEYSVPKKIFEQAGFTVTTASNELGTAVATDGTATTVDVLVENAIITDFDAVLFIGGPGALEQLDNPTSYKLIIATVQAHKPLGAICISTRILAHAGVLKGKRATGWNGDNALAEIYKENDVQYSPNEVVMDEGLVTATGPSVAREFGEQIIGLLQD